MGDKSGIEWTDATWTPIRARNVRTGRVGWHCEKVSPGCAGCYAEGINRRLGTKISYVPEGRAGVFLDEKMLTQPLRWQKPKTVFVCSMTDLFADFVPDQWIAKVFAIMDRAHRHRFQVLTKRAGRMRELLNSPRFRDLVNEQLPQEPPRHWYHAPNRWTWPNERVWLGVSAERQKELDERVPELLATAAAVRFVSAGPLLGRISLSRYLYTRFDTGDGRYETKKLDWVIAEGESGPQARPMHPDWPRSIRDECVAAGLAFYFKQWGEWAPNCLCGTREPHVTVERPEGVRGVTFRCGKKAAGRELDGRTWDEIPERRR